MNKLDKESIKGISALLVHAAKIDEIYSAHEQELIKNFIKSYLEDGDVNEILKKAEEIERLRLIQKAIHLNFKEFVSSRRGEKIIGKDIFNGEIWESHRAKDLGLIDGIGHLEPVLKEKYGKDIQFKRLDRKRSIFSRFGKASADGVFDAFVENIYFSRFRL